MTNKLILYMALFLISLTAVFAANNVTVNFEDEDGNAVNNVEVSVFECTDKTCSDIVDAGKFGSFPFTPTAARVDYADTGSSNTAELSIPKTTGIGPTYFIVWAFAEETDSYLPAYHTFSLMGDGAEGEIDVILEKKDLCLSTIQSFSVTNTAEPYEPVTVSVEAGLEADTYSAFELSDDGVYLYGTTGQYRDWYSAETEVILTITKMLTLGSGPFATEMKVTVYTDSQTVDIFAGESENVEFTWTPSTEGEFTATVTTSVTDDQCESTEEQSSKQKFTVVEAGATEYCYTLIDNLAIYDEDGNAVSTPETGETYTVSFDKITNSVDADGNLAAGDTALDISVTNEDGAVDYSLTDVAAANADTTKYESYSFSWTPISEGDNTITVTGSAADCPYKTNNAETASMTVYVSGVDIVREAPVADITVTDATYFFFSDYYFSIDADVGFDGSDSYDPDGTIVSYAWDFGDGTTSTAVSETHTYAAAGTYIVTLTVTDNDGLTDTESVEVRTFMPSAEEDSDGDGVPNDEDVCEGFDDNVDTDADGIPDGCDDDSDNDGVPNDEDVCEGFDDNVDTDGDSIPDGCDDTPTGEAEDLPAVAVASANPASGEPTLWVQFSSAGSSGDEPLSYSWNFGSGEGSSDRANPGHYYDKEGTYTVTLTVTDADGDQDSATLTIIVGDDANAKTVNLADAHYFVDGIAFSNDGRVEAGDDLELWVSAENIANFDKEDVTFNAIIQELGIYETSGEFDIDAGDVETKVLSLQIPEDTEPGTYYVRITLSDDHVKRVIYRDIIVTA